MVILFAFKGDDQDIELIIKGNTFNQITSNTEKNCVLLHFQNIVKNMILDSNLVDNIQDSNCIKIAFASINDNTFTLDSCKFINNNANDKTNGGSGILIQITPPDINFFIVNCLFERNICSSKGGSLFINDNFLKVANLISFMDCVFK